MTEVKYEHKEESPANVCKSVIVIKEEQRRVYILEREKVILIPSQMIGSNLQAED